MKYLQTIPSPIGNLTVSSDGENILGLWIEGQKYFARNLGKDVSEENLSIFENVREWLGIYFGGNEPNFALSVKPQGSPFQKSVWDILRQIPYGKTTSYGEIAKQIEVQNGGKRTSARAVGGAVGHNPVSILIPCHRVVGKNGALTGYAGGISKKIQLLAIEGVKV